MKKSVALPRRLSALAAIVSCLAVVSYRPAQAHAQKSAGAFLSGEASGKDVGLPVYPGSKPYQDKSKPGDSSSANMGLFAGNTGFQLVIVKMHSEDAPEKVAAYYRKALAKYGRVLDCTHSSNGSSEKNTPSTLTCGDDKPDSGGMLFKAGTKDVQHLVSVTPEAAGTTYALIYLVAKGHEAEL